MDVGLLLQLREKARFDSSPRSHGAFEAPHPAHPKSSESSEPPEVDPDQGPLDTFCVLTLEPEEVSLLLLPTSRSIMISRMTSHLIWVGSVAGRLLPRQGGCAHTLQAC